MSTGNGNRPEQMGVEGKSAIVTGGTTGIGAATAKLLAQHGAKVLIFGRHEKELNETLATIQSTAAQSEAPGGIDRSAKPQAIGGAVHGIIADQSRPEDVQRVFEHADRLLGGVDILINNAAISGEAVTEST